jgi:N-acetylneuraminic acid mutarotase
MKLSILMTLFLISVALLSTAAADISFEQRAAAQKAIEEVYWAHTIWPSENPQPKPMLDAVLSQTDLQAKVRDYLRKSYELENIGQPVSADQMQAEIDRMARTTKDPSVLRELFAALQNDPYLIAECIARPMITDRFGEDSFALNRENIAEINSLHTPAHNYHLPQIAETSGSTFNFSPMQATASNTWTATSTTGAPAGRFLHSAIWTGTVMIVWGGYISNNTVTKTGARYNPATNSWSAISSTGAPAARGNHSAVWTGTQMIVWGGLNTSTFFNTGGRYNPSTNTWSSTATTGAPTVRYAHTAVWTGTKMIIWGGYGVNSVLYNTGGQYNPSTNSWTSVTKTGAPSARYYHTAVWSGTKMIVWGGAATGGLNTGGRYNPSTNSWSSISTTGAPAARYFHAAVWTGTQMVVWGGQDNLTNFDSGGRYNPSTNSWTAITTHNAPIPRSQPRAVWTGTKMIVWGGSDGSSGSYLATGGLYNPSNNSWTATTTTAVPSGRALHTIVWAGSRMIVWGGLQINGPILNTGSRYIP